MQLSNFSDIKKIFLANKWLFVLIVFLCFAAYVNTLDNEFVSDDIPAIVQNEQLANPLVFLKRLNLYGIIRSLIFLVFGQRVFAYHFLNIVLHILASFLVYFFLVVLTQNQGISAFACLLFSLHPIHTEAVTWISGSGYVFYTIFFLISFIFYHFYLENKKNAYLISAGVCYLIALFSSVWALPLLLIFVLYEKYLRNKNINWLFYFVLLSVAIIYFFSWQGMVKARIGEMAGNGSAWRDITVTIPYSLARDISLLVWPSSLTLYHEGEIISSTYLFLARVLSLIILVILPIVFRKQKLFIFFLVFFLISVSLSLSPIQIAWYVAERYLYLGSISFCLLLAYLLIKLEKSLEIENLAVILLVFVLAFYFIRTIDRNQDWQTPASLWFATAEVSPRSSRVHNNLGDIYGGFGDINKAIEEFEIARELQPRYADATHNLANAYLNKGDLETAQKYFLEALEYNPGLYQSYFQLGLISYQEQNFELAENYFLKTLEINSNYEPAHQALMILKK